MEKEKSRHPAQAVRVAPNDTLRIHVSLSQVGATVGSVPAALPVIGQSTCGPQLLYVGTKKVAYDLSQGGQIKVDAPSDYDVFGLGNGVQPAPGLVPTAVVTYY